MPIPRRRIRKTPVSVLSFPVTLALRVTGHNQPGFPGRVLAALQTCQPGLTEAALGTRLSREGKYLAVTVTVTAHSQVELDALYQALRGVEGLILAL